jgi:hypothetical protein
VYVGTGTEPTSVLAHWNGTTWEQLSEPCNDMYHLSVGEVALAGTNTTVVRCTGIADSGAEAFENDGSGWAPAYDAVSYPYRGLWTLETVGPVGSPDILMGLEGFTMTTYAWLLNSGTGWAPFIFPSPDLAVNGVGQPTFAPLYGSPLTDLVSQQGSAFIRSNGSQWLTLQSWITATVRYGGETATPDTAKLSWTDGHEVVAPAHYGETIGSPGTPPDDDSTAVVRCELGP